MKRLMIAVIQAYLAVGGFLGVILLSSYVFGPAWQFGPFWWLGSWSTFTSYLWILLIALIAHFLRAFLWLPELLLWYFSDSGVPFGQWLAPGFYVVELND